MHETSRDQALAIDVLRRQSGPLQGEHDAIAQHLAVRLPGRCIAQAPPLGGKVARQRCRARGRQATAHQHFPEGNLQRLVPLHQRAVEIEGDDLCLGQSQLPGFRGTGLVCMTMYFVSTGPMNSTAIMRTVCIAITNDTSTLLEAAMIATESEPPGLVAR